MFPALLPKTVPFFPMLIEQNEILRQICSFTLAMLEAPKEMKQAYREIALLEAKGDRLHNKIIFELSKAFLTPIDREDILRINQGQEACMDCFQRVSTRLHIFEFERIRFPILRLCRLAKNMLELSETMLEGLEKHRDAHKTRLFDSLREEADMVMATGLAELMDSSENLSAEHVLEALKWKPP